MIKHLSDALVGTFGIIFTISDLSSIGSLIVTILVIIYYSVRLFNYSRDRKWKKHMDDLEVMLKEAELERLTKKTKPKNI